MYNPDKQSRKFLVTQNNPEKYGLTEEIILDMLNSMKIRYACFAREISSTGTPHIHIYIYLRSPARFSTIKNIFPKADIEAAYGSSQENMEYITKTGRWEDTEKATTSVEGTFHEIGEMPESNGSKTISKMEKVLDDIKEGLSTKEIIERNPGMAFKSKDIDAVRELYLYEKFGEENRDLKVVYLWGPPGSGKTSSIYKEHGFKNVFRITHYPKNGIRFDGYNGNSVLTLEEFYGQIPIGELLNLLDIYPLTLPARYIDKRACYDTVYITSNIPLEEQYKDIQEMYPDTWKALLRRIHEVRYLG